jgi:hypothetical protein
LKTSSIEPSKKLPRHLNPISPILDETQIVEQLKLSCSMETSEYMRVAAFFSIIDVHDRQLERIEVVQTADQAVKLIEHLRRAETLSLVRQDLASGAVLEHIVAAVDRLYTAHMEEADKYRIKLLAAMQTVAECAYENDRIN